MRLSNSRMALISVVLLASAANGQSPKKLPDAQPNMQGTYTRAGVKALEAEPPFNPIDPGEKNPFSVSNREDGLGPYPRIFGQGGNVLRGSQQRTQRRLGIVFPEDRKLPWRPEEEAKRRQFLLCGRDSCRDFPMRPYAPGRTESLLLAESLHRRYPRRTIGRQEASGQAHHSRDARGPRKDS